MIAAICSPTAMTQRMMISWKQTLVCYLTVTSVRICVCDNGVQVEKQYPELGKHKDVFDQTVSRILSQHKYYRSEKGHGHVVCRRVIYRVVVALMLKS